MPPTASNSIIVTIDGPAGSGKSTAARTLATRLGFEFLDTGAMYRAVAWSCLQSEAPPENERLVSELTRSLSIQFQNGRLLINQYDVTDEIRTSAVSTVASVVAQHPVVRETLVDLQRACAEHGNTVTEGRDQGTIVFPNANCKFFLTARPEVRAQRRYEEMSGDSDRPEFEQLVEEIRDRDHRDANRSIAPLRPADDAESIDTSDSTLEEVVKMMEARVQKKSGPFG
ncbi:MAG: (d)CMP kinase [Planctomycetaceae bacterium]|nr:(d)CMP kinase [Planctomycetaceae bacterium]